MALMSVGANSKYSSKDANGTSGSRSRVSSVSAVPRTEGEILLGSNIKSFGFNELKTATRNFRPDSVLGEGGFGCVFKGWVDEHTYAPARPGTGMIIAVKRLNQESLQGHLEWLVSITPLPSCNAILVFLGSYFCVSTLHFPLLVE